MSKKEEGLECDQRDLWRQDKRDDGEKEADGWQGHLLKSRQLGCGNLSAVFWLLKLLKKVTGSPGCNRDQHRLPITQMVVQILHKWVFDKVDLRTLYPDWGLGQHQSHQPFLRPAPPFLQSVYFFTNFQKCFYHCAKCCGCIVIQNMWTNIKLTFKVVS